MGRLNPVSLRRAREARIRRVHEAKLGRVGTQGTCARCGRYGYVNGHERLARSHGGNHLQPDCLLCICCNTFCEDYPAEAAWYGWKISGKHDRCPVLDAYEALTLTGEIHRFPLWLQEIDDAPDH